MTLSAPVRPDPLSKFLYVHVPFCLQACTYCDFYKVVDATHARTRADAALALAAQELALIAQADAWPSAAKTRTVFFGGGTPSLASPQALANFLAAVQRIAPLATDAEISLETQPDTVSTESLAAFAAAGVNRFSIGVQSFDDDLIARTGRVHRAQQTLDVIAAARALAVTSIDLIHGWPGQTPAQWQHDLDTAVACDVPHVSCYELTYHPGTELYDQTRRGHVTPLDDEVHADLLEMAGATLTAQGFDHYEVSNFAQPGARSVHNENYWLLGDYTGLGPGAHSANHPRRMANLVDYARYAESISVGRSPRTDTTGNAPEELALTYLATGLRRREGVDLDAFAARFGYDPRLRAADRLRRLCDAGDAELCDTVLRATPRGRMRLDAVVAYLL